MAESILIVKLSSMGDVIHALPAVQAIRAAQPQARLAWAVDQPHAPIVRAQSWIDEVIVWQRGSAANFVDFIRRVRAFRADVAIDLQGLFRSGLTTWLSGARRRIGATNAREQATWFYNEPVTPSQPRRHAVEHLLELAAPLGARRDDVPLDRPYLRDEPPRAMHGLGSRLFPLPPSAEDRAAVANWLAEHRFDPRVDRLVVLNPHCRKEANRWQPSRYIELARGLLERPGVRVALSGGRLSQELCDEIAAPLGDRVWRADGKFSLMGSALLFSHAAVFVTGDTGPMHIAATVDVPIVAMFGPSHPRFTGPYTSNAVALREPLDCLACLSGTCRLKYDPPLCMDRITAQRVLAAVDARLAEYDLQTEHRKIA